MPPFLRLCLGAAGLALAATAVRAIDSARRWDRAPLSAAEIAQGYRNDIVIARATPSHAATIDAEESREGLAARAVLPNLGGIRFLPVRTAESPAQAIARLKATGRYAYVEVDRVLHGLDTTPDDPDFGQQWGLDNTGPNSPISGPGIAGADIHAPAAWNIRRDAGSVIVATVDTGALLTHQDLAENLWTNPSPTNEDLHGINAIASYNAYGDPTDDVGHGTHVAGIIGASGNNGLDTSGVAWTVQLMPLKFLGANGQGSTSDELTCFSYALGHRAQIINASFGSGTPSASEFEGIAQLQSAGIIVVCAAGNNFYDASLNPTYPADYALDNIVTVAASDNRDDIAYFSNFDSGIVELAAPGDAILSLYNTSNSATAVLSGTSMATPMVTGSIALLRAQFPSDTYRQTINRLLGSVDPGFNFALRVQTGGRLNLARALSSTSNAPFNDNFSARAHLAGTNVLVRANNTGATRESNEQSAGNATLWWDWTAPLSGSVTIQTSLATAYASVPASYPTQIDVYTGTILGSLASVASAAGSTATFMAQAGATYAISIGSQTGATGPTFFNLAFANTSSSSALVLTGNSALVAGSNFPSSARSSSTSYYAWTAPQTGEYQLVASSPSMDPTIQVTANSASLGSVTGGTINTSALDAVSTVTFPLLASQGTTYVIAISGQVDSSLSPQAGGQFTLAINHSRWTYAAQDSIRCSPAVGADGTIYVASDDDHLYAIRPDGTLAWKFAATQPFDTSAAAIAADGTVYAGAEDGYLYALNPDGTLRWKYQVPTASNAASANSIAASPAVAGDGTIYVKDSAGTLYALNPDGSLKWEGTVPGSSYAAPTVGPDGTIFIGSDETNGDGKLYAFNPDGTTRWTFDANSPVYTAAAIDSSGNTYIATLGGTVYAVNSRGQSVWSYVAGNSVSSAPAIGGDGTIYFGCYDHRLYAVSATGTLRWTCLLGGEMRASAPATDANGNIYVGCYDGNVYAVSSAGAVTATFATTGLIRSSPVIAGTSLYVGSADHQLYAFDLASSAGATPWPMYQASPQRDGRVLSPALAITGQPNPSVAVTFPQPLFLNVTAAGPGPLTYQWYLNGAAISGATNSDYFVPQTTSANVGVYTVTVTGPSGSITSIPSEVGPAGVPTFATQPQGTSVSAGGSVTLSALVTGGNINYQWYFAGTAISGAMGPQLVLTNVGANQGSAYGSYTVTAINSFGAATSNAAALTVVTQAQLLNISARADVQAGQNDLVAGFVIGNGDKQVVLRGVGPALSGFGIPDPLTNPVLTLYSGSGAVIANNSGWNDDSTLSTAFAQVGAFQFQPGSVDAALLETLSGSAGNTSYTMHVDSADAETGVALAEIYDDDQGTTASRLVNISARALVGTGSNILVAGFVIGGTTSETVLIRGVGPTLASSFAVANTLSNPQLTLYDHTSTAIATNSGWGNNAAIAAVDSAVYAFALQPNSADTALLVTLPPGLYTAQVAGQSGTAGVALVEIYEVR